MFFRGQTVGKYRIVSPLGSGGFGSVYLAEDTWIDKKVAIKVPHRQNLDFGELLREPRLLASVNHPNIVAITTAEKQDGVFFIVMEYVQGDTLENIILREGLLDMTREQFQGKGVFASDLYSLGITRYQMLTGVLPSDTRSLADLEKLYRGDL